MSDVDLRAPERAYRQDLTDAAETAYWTAWMALACPPWAPPPWHIRCPGEDPRAGDQIGRRLVVSHREGRVRFLVDAAAATGWRPVLREVSLPTWRGWARRLGGPVGLHAGRAVPGLPSVRNGVRVPGVEWPQRMTARGADRAWKRMKAGLRRALGDRVDEVLG